MERARVVLAGPDFSGFGVGLLACLFVLFVGLPAAGFYSTRFVHRYLGSTLSPRFIAFLFSLAAILGFLLFMSQYEDALLGPTVTMFVIVILPMIVGSAVAGVKLERAARNRNTG